MQFNIYNRFSGAVQFTAEIDCKDDELTSVKIGLAVKWAIKARANLAGAYLAGADLADANLADANLARAYLARAYLAGAYLAGADLAGVYLADANLAGAYLARANLAGAYLAGADLAGANLAGAYLAGANLADANLADQWIIQGATRSDGYSFFLQKLKDDSEPMVKAGCRYFTLAQAQQHWEKTRKGQPLLDETREIVRCMVNIAHVRGYMKDGK